MRSVVCIGGGPAGLTAAYALSGEACVVTVLEADPQYLGGISRTIRRDGFYFDIGGHRFFSRSAEVVALWKDILGDDLLVRRRLSRIYYGGKFYDYPLNLFQALRNLGAVTSVLCLFSYIRASVFPYKPPRNFEEWVVNHFGRRLFAIFFKTYTEKVWGIACSDISADWAAQRIKGLSLYSAVKNALLRLVGWQSGNRIKTLIEEFYYPRKGPGMMWQRAAEKITARGGKIALGCKVQVLAYEAGLWQVRYWDAKAGAQVTVVAEHVISSMPLRELVHSIEGAPEAVLRAADALCYRDFITVAVVLKQAEGFSDNWIYIHDPQVKVGRIQNFKSWSPEMVEDAELTCYGMEYFCFEGDGLWSSDDNALVALAMEELTRLGLASPEAFSHGYVIRQPKAYPVYDYAYTEHVAVIRAWLEAHCPNLQVVGRNGMHKYNNQDHSMMTALLAARNIMAGEKRWDVWQVNQDAEYGESGATGERLVPVGM